ENVLYLHVTLVPYIEAAGELKTKPTQHSVNELRRIGIHPDIVVCRSREELDDSIREKIALFTDVDSGAVVASPDVPDVYLVPNILRDQGLDRLVCAKLGLPGGGTDLGEWQELTDRLSEREGEVTIALVGKYVKLHDAYLSVHEALKHAGIHHGCNVRVRWADAENMSYEEASRELEGVDGVLVPGGFGSRGWEGKILACRVARERGIPYLGICLGMHVAVSEFARHVLGLDGANSTEMDPETHHPVIDLLPEQKEIEDLGGTMRLGAQAVELVDGTRAHDAYGEPVVHERHRHRHEVNNHYRPALVNGYLRDLGLSVDEDDAGPKVGSNIGNLFCRLEATDGGNPIFLCAHLDTVPPEGPIEPVIEDGVVRNAAGTILGADNKSAVAAMLEGARRVLAENRPHGGIELLFTPKEEVGLLGAAAFDLDRLHARLGYVYDQAAPIGDVILGAPYSRA